MDVVRCASCGRAVSVVDPSTAPRIKQWCNSWCHGEQAVTPTEERTDQWAALHVTFGLTPVTVAKQYQVPHSQIYKALHRIGIRWGSA